MLIYGVSSDRGLPTKGEVVKRLLKTCAVVVLFIALIEAMTACGSANSNEDHTVAAPNTTTTPIILKAVDGTASYKAAILQRCTSDNPDAFTTVQLSGLPRKTRYYVSNAGYVASNKGHRYDTDVTVQAFLHASGDVITDAHGTTYVLVGCDTKVSNVLFVSADDRWTAFEVPSSVAPSPALPKRTTLPHPSH